MVLVIVGVVRVGSAASGMFVDAELRRRHPGAQHFPGVDMGVPEREAAERGLELIERQTRVEQRAQRHVARDAREAVEVQHAAHNASITYGSLILLLCPWQPHAIIYSTPRA